MTFKKGDVWEWSHLARAYLLLEHLDDQFMTRYHDGEEKWRTFCLDTGEYTVLRLHTDVHSDGGMWIKL